MKSKSSKQKREKKQLLPAIDPEITSLDYETVCFIYCTLEGETDYWEIFLN